MMLTELLPGGLDREERYLILGSLTGLGPLVPHSVGYVILIPKAFQVFWMQLPLFQLAYARLQSFLEVKRESFKNQTLPPIRGQKMNLWPLGDYLLQPTLQ